MLAATTTDTATWIGAVISALGVIVTLAGYVVTRGRKRLEYVVQTSRRLLPGRVANELEVTHKGAGSAVSDPALTITRLVNTGNQPIRPDDFESDLTVTFEGAEEVVSATWSASRPDDVRPALTIEANQVKIEPKLLNKGDALELQVLSEGLPTNVTLAGRVAGLTMARRASLPYPPGSGAEGEMLGFDRFMWFVFVPAGIIGGGVAFAVQDSVTTLGSWLIVLATAVVLGVYLLHTRYLVERRRLWRPY